MRTQFARLGESPSNMARFSSRVGMCNPLSALRNCSADLLALAHAPGCILWLFFQIFNGLEPPDK